MIILTLALLAIVALVAVAWTLVPSDHLPRHRAPLTPVVDAVPAETVRVDLVRIDHRTDAERAADQAKVDQAWGLR